MKTIVAVCLSVVVLVGCGNGPLCDDPDMRDVFMDSCTVDTSSGLCACAWNELADRHECDDFDQITIAEANDVAAMCQ